MGKDRKVVDAEFEVISGPDSGAQPPEPHLEPYAGESPWEHDSRVAVEKFHHREWLRRQPWPSYYIPPDWRYYTKRERFWHHTSILIMFAIFCAIIVSLAPMIEWWKSHH